jgi:hypothetical protein
MSMDKKEQRKIAIFESSNITKFSKTVNKGLPIAVIWTNIAILKAALLNGRFLINIAFLYYFLHNFDIQTRVTRDHIARLIGFKITHIHTYTHIHLSS